MKKYYKFGAFKQKTRDDCDEVTQEIAVLHFFFLRKNKLTEAPFLQRMRNKQDLVIMKCHYGITH